MIKSKNDISEIERRQIERKTDKANSSRASASVMIFFVTTSATISRKIRNSTTKYTIRESQTSLKSVAYLPSLRRPRLPTGRRCAGSTLWLTTISIFLFLKIVRNQNLPKFDVYILLQPALLQRLPALLALPRGRQGRKQAVPRSLRRQDRKSQRWSRWMM